MSKEAMKRLTRDDTEHGVEYYQADEVDALLAKQPAQPAKLKVTLEDRPIDIELAQYKRMFEAACSALGQIGDALGCDPEEGGAEPILAAIAELKAEQPAQQQEQLREENERLHVENRRLIDCIETIGVPVGVGGFATTTTAQQQEPVACKTLCELCVKRGYHFCANAAQTTPIPSPPASKPLTDEQQIAEALRRHGLTLVKTAKGYDVMSLGHITAHGIKENT